MVPNSMKVAKKRPQAFRETIICQFLCCSVARCPLGLNAHRCAHVEPYQKRAQRRVEMKRYGDHFKKAPFKRFSYMFS